VCCGGGGDAWTDRWRRSADQSGWVDFIVKGSVEALQKLQQVVLVPVSTSAQVAAPELEDSALHHLLSHGELDTSKRNPVIEKLITHISQDRIRKTVEHLSSYYTRLSTSRPGKRHHTPQCKGMTHTDCSLLCGL
jgi:hypothetical protein